MPGTILLGVDVETAMEDALGYTKYGAELFYELDCPVTWFLTGKTLEKYPKEFQRIEKDKFIELQAHTYDHILLKTVLIKVPKGRMVHGKKDWFINPGSSLDEIDKDLTKCQKVFQDVLGRKAIGLTTPWGYYRGLADRPDILQIVDNHGFKFLRSFARDENDGNPVPFEWQPFFYEVQGYPHILEFMIHGYQDDFYWDFFGDHDADKTYTDCLKRFANKVAKENIIWSMASHDHACATKEGFEKKGAWLREFIKYSKGIGIKFLRASEFYEKMVEKNVKC